MSMPCPNCGHDPMEHVPGCNDYACSECGLCAPSPTLAVWRADRLVIASLRRQLSEQEAEMATLKTPAHVLAEAERLLRERDVSRVAFSRKRGLNVTAEQFAACDPLAFPTTSGDTLAEAYAALTGGRDG